MGLRNFVAKEPRPLPIIVLADTSASMLGEKINELNLALRTMLESLNAVDDIRGVFQLCIIAFGGNEARVVQPLANVSDISLQELTAFGKTPMGDAFALATKIIEDKSIVTSRSYIPTIVLISDGIPNGFHKDISIDKFMSWKPLQTLQKSPRASKSQRLALGIGRDVNVEMLRAFINNDEIPLIKSKDSAGIAKFFNWVTMSTIARMTRATPDLASVVAPIFDIDEEDIII